MGYPDLHSAGCLWRDYARPAEANSQRERQTPIGTALTPVQTPIDVAKAGDSMLEFRMMSKSHQHQAGF